MGVEFTVVSMGRKMLGIVGLILNWNWEEQPMWHKVGFGDTRLSSNPFVTQKWQQLILQQKNNNNGRQSFLMADSLQQNCDSNNKLSSSHYSMFLMISGLILLISSCWLVRRFQKVIIKLTPTQSTSTDAERKTLLPEKRGTSHNHVLL